MVRASACKLVLYCFLEIFIGTFPWSDADVKLLLEEYPIAYTRPLLQGIGDRDIESAEQLESRTQRQHSAIWRRQRNQLTSTNILFMLIAEIAFPRHLVLPYPNTNSCTCRISRNRSLSSISHLSGRNTSGSGPNMAFSWRPHALIPMLVPAGT